MRIDAHAHVIVPEALRDAAPDDAWRPRVWWEDGAQVVELGGREIRSAVREFVDVDAILAAQDDAGIDHVLLCPWVNLLGYDAPADEALDRCRIQNGGLAALRAAHPDRVSVLGTVPLQDPEVAAGELEALMAVGSFAGVEIAASVNGVPKPSAVVPYLSSGVVNFLTTGLFDCCGWSGLAIGLSIGS